MTDALTIIQPRLVLDDPHACTDSSDVLTLFGGLFDALVRRGDRGWEPGLATAWTMSDDARSTLFTLRQGVRFHDGTKCDADAVKFCLERMARPDIGATLGAPGVYAPYLAGMRVDILDQGRLRVTTAEPIADILDILSSGHIVSPRALEASGDDLARRAVGTGPYRLESYERDGHLTARADPGHFDGAPAVGAITWRRGASAAERLEALAGGRAGIANGLEAGSAAALSREAFTVQDYLAPTALIFLFNAAAGPGADARVRRALNLAIDRDRLVEEVLGGAGQPLHGYLSPAHQGYDPAAAAMPVDRAEARRLLSEAGCPDGLTLELYCPTRLPDEAPALAAAIERQLAEIGVRFEVSLDDDRTHYANQVRLKRIRDICVFDSSPMSAFRVLCEKIDARVKGSWWQGYHNRQVESLIDQARRSVGEAARLATYREIYRLLQQDPPWLYVYNHRRTVGLAGPRRGSPMRKDGILDVRRLGR